ncbi:MAG: DNA repair protein RecN [Acidobacteriota bacterium]
MIRTLSVRNFALVDAVELDFGSGLNLLTGETGSGKSILVDAVGLLLGGRALQESIRSGRTAARVEGLFEVLAGSPACATLESAGIEVQGGEILIRREIAAGGKSKIFINQSLVTLQVLTQLGPLLVDIHGQHDQQSLLNTRSHLEWLDHFAGTSTLLAEVEWHYLSWSALAEELEQLRSAEQQRLQRIDMLRFQTSEIAALKLTPLLEDELESERHLLSHAEKRAQWSAAAFERLYEGETSALALLADIERNVAQLADVDPEAAAWRDRLAESRYGLEDLAFVLRDYRNQIDFDTNRLTELEGRLEEISRARKKYGPTLDDVLRYFASIQEELRQLEECAGRETALEQEAAGARTAYDAAAARLSEERKKQARQLERKMERELGELAMEKTRFGVEFEQVEPHARGIDCVQFLVSPNPGEALRPLARIASGGELSRILLALKTLLALEDRDRTLIFDEVDAGIGGRVAETVGRKLRRLAASQQILCVTHLPQVAAFADRHFRVTKQVARGQTRIEAELLEAEGRIGEIARMLGGAHITETTRRHAEEMLSQSRVAPKSPE